MKIKKRDESAFERICVPITLSKETPFPVKSWPKVQVPKVVPGKVYPKAHTTPIPLDGFKPAPVVRGFTSPPIISRKEKIHVSVEPSPAELRQDAARRVLETEKERLKRKAMMKRRKYV